MIDMKAAIEECPRCGNKGNFLVKVQVYGSSQTRYLWDGSLDDNHDMHDHLFYKHSKYAYCSVCDKRLFEFKQEDAE